MKKIFVYIWYKIIAFPFRLLPIKNNRILFENFFGKGYGDNPKYIADELLKQDNKKIELIWLVKGNYKDDIPKEIRQVKRGTLKELYYLSTSKIWIDNSRKPLGTTKRKKQFYIQTWHGGYGMKKVEKEVINTLDKYYVKSAIADSKMIDLFISSSKAFSKQVRDFFWYDGKILESGLPRTDILVNNKNSKNSKDNILLYAPTFRDNGNTWVYNLDYEELRKNLKNKFGGNWKIYIRFHPNISYLQDSIKYNKNIINATNYGDINDLILKSDILLTDFSSCIFDAMIAGKKTFMYAPDLEEYISQRGIDIDFNIVPFSLSKNKEELYKNIENFDLKRYEEKIEDFFKKIGSFEKGNATKEIVNLIIEVLK